MPVRPHGWKLHLSSVQVEAESLMERIVPCLARFDVPFKVAADPSILGLLNEGLLGATQVGKFATIYVDEIADPGPANLVAELLDLTSGFTGPSIVTDMHLGSIVYARYGEFAGRKRRNRLGLFETLDEDEPLVRYQVPFNVPEGAAGAERFQPVASSRPADQYQLLGGRFLPTGKLADHAKGSVFLALDMQSQAQVRKVVLKHGRAGCMSDVEGRDIRDRLRHQAGLSAALSGNLAVPQVAALFDQDADTYVALELVEGYGLATYLGTPFHSRDAAGREQFLRDLAATAAAIDALHAQGYVHRDLTPNNIRMSGGQAVLIDLELAHSLASTEAPFSQGTVGFISPGQKRGEWPVIADDIYSFAAVAAALLTGFAGHQLPAGIKDGGRRLARLSGAGDELCSLLAGGLALDPADRPTLAALRAALDRAVAMPQTAGPQSPPRQRLIEQASAGCHWLLGDAARSEDNGMWLSPALEASHTPTGAPVVDWRVYRSANRGVAGILYMLARAARIGLIAPSQTLGTVNRAVDWLLAHEDTSDDQLPGLHFGEAGVAVAICEAISAGLIQTGPWTEPYLRQVFTSEPNWPDLSHGSAGQGVGALLCGHHLSEPWLIEAADAYAGHLRDTQADEGGWALPEGVREMTGQSYTGFAHGAAGVVYFLAAHAAARKDEASLDAALVAADWLLGEASPTASGSGLSWTMTPETSDAWTWWCHGAPGIALAFLALYRATGDALHAGTARAALRSIPASIRPANLSQCHGLAGLSEMLLEGHDVLGDEVMQEQGVAFAGLLAELAVPMSRGSAWHVENAHAFEPDLMTGCAGVVHALARAGTADRSDLSMPLLLPAAFWEARS
ncbi:lanthionine synthetase LanC family protein [Maricaulis sp.]|uniref:lanthionine synthetase LanC family protein n=1 Tax=Maricaulis sp. TaxID=1486257 RepID=UPI0026287643|nr:lanthionine synthetase LanC family protein [Maricaulis sp.]